MANFYDSKTRRPWNNVIFPGNQVTHLQAYRNQGVQSIPGVNYFRMVGVVTVSGTLAAGSYSVQVLSPDLRQDDKPRLDRTMTIPAGAVIYRTAINVENLGAAGGTTIDFPAAVLSSTLTAAGDGTFSDGGAVHAYDNDAELSAEGSDRDIEVDVSATLTTVDANSQAAVLVEVCFYMDAPAPCADDVHLPFNTEAGQSSN